MAVVAFFGLLSLAAVVVGLVAVARGHLDWARIRSRRVAAGVTAVALAVFAVCGALTPTPDDRVDLAVSAVPPSPSSAVLPVAPSSSTPAVTAFPEALVATRPPSAAPPTTADPAPVPPATALAPPPPAPVPPPPPPPPPVADARSGCDSSYPETCLRSGAGDYDCEGGSGDGPNYVAGRVRVLAPDPFGLDRDGNGYGCEG